jgi:hypothetical protein
VLPNPFALQASSYIDALATELRVRLAELDAERAPIIAALRALDSARGAQRRRLAKRDTLNARILPMIEAHPGIRTSMLALELSQSTELIRSALAHLERGGWIRPHGLGWAKARECAAEPRHAADTQVSSR